MKTSSKIILAIIALVVSYAFGYYESPEKIKTETKIVEVESKTKKTDSDTNKHKDTKTTEVIKPDGTKTITTTVTEDTNRKSDSTATDDTKKMEDITKEVTKSGSRLNLAILTGVNFSNLTSNPIIYGGSVSRNLIGPITLGIWGLTNSTAGASIGLQF